MISFYFNKIRELKIIQSISIKVLDFIVSIISSILIIRIFQENIYGKFIFISSLFALVSFFYDQFDGLILKFIKSQKEYDSLNFFISTIIFSKFIIYIIGVFFLCLYGYVFSSNFLLDRTLNSIFLILLPHYLFSAIDATISKALYIFNKQFFLIRLAFVRALILLFILGFYYFLKKFDKSELIIIHSLIILIIGIIFSSVKYYILKKYSSNVSLSLSRIDIKKIIKNEHIKYLYPLQFSSVLSLIKNYIPNIVLASYFSYGSTGYYHVIYNIFKQINSFLPNLFNMYLNKIINVKMKSSILYKKYFIGAGFSYLFTTVLFSVFILLIKDLLFKIYGFENYEIFNIGIIIISICLPISSIGYLLRTNILTRTSTLPILISSITRFIIGTPILYVFGYFFEEKGFYYSILINLLLFNSILYITSKKIKNEKS